MDRVFPEKPGLEDRTFLFLIVALSVGFAAILWPFAGAILWALVIATMFRPLYERLAGALHQKRTLAAVTTVVIIVITVILPLSLIGGALVQEGLSTYQRIRSGELDFGRYVDQILNTLPVWITNLLDRLGLTSLEAVKQRLSTVLTEGVQFLAGKVLSLGQNTMEFIVSLLIMLYLLFFLLRDGNDLAQRITGAIPIRPDLQRKLAGRFTTVLRATVKGNLIVALVQGGLGGLIFWILGLKAPVLWGAFMSVLSLLPAVGTGLVWFPTAVYLVVTGEISKGIILAAYGLLVIGSVDNLLRPVLVGKDTQMPDYVILLSTIGGLATFGFNGFVIGPMIAAMFMTVWEIFATYRNSAGESGRTEIALNSGPARNPERATSSSDIVS
jgi:predicted PurR-regulated permease PerM